MVGQEEVAARGAVKWRAGAFDVLGQESLMPQHHAPRVGWTVATAVITVERDVARKTYKNNTLTVKQLRI